MVKTSVQQQINEQLFKKLVLAYFCVDTSMVITEMSENLAGYGFDAVAPGVKAEDCVDFMIGFDVQTELDLPMVTSPSGVPISVSLLPSEGQLTVLISNASAQAEQRQLLQQKANENELLVEQQDVLMRKLEKTSRELERKNLELEEASRLQTSFLSGVSHEFRTPLTSIIGYTNLVKQDIKKFNAESSPDSDAVAGSADYLRAVQRSSKHLLSLVENLLDHGKLGSDEIVMRPKVTNLIELFEDVSLLLKPLSDTKHIEFVCDVDILASTMVVVDASRLRQCLINLLGNAIKFTDMGSVKLSARWENESLSVRVIDTGLGISADDLKKIIRPFWQAPNTGKAGTGLGLTITEKIINLMGGRLDIESDLGVGTAVFFSIPAPIALNNTEVSDSTLVPNHMSVLLAEDDSDIADLVMMMMSEKGIDVTHVVNGALAIEALESKRFDIVFMDIHMPIMTGYEALQELQKKGNTVPVVVMSASAVEADRAKAENLGCHAYLVKPVDVDDIIEIMMQIVI